MCLSYECLNFHLADHQLHWIPTFEIIMSKDLFARNVLEFGDLTVCCSDLKVNLLCLDCWKHWLSNTSVSSSTVASPTSETSDFRTTGDGGETSRLGMIYLQ